MLRWLILALLLASSAALARPGDTDPRFGTGGIVHLDFTPLVGANSAHGESKVAIDSAGRVVIAMTVFGTQGTGLGLARLLPDGRLDPDFGSDGIAFVPFANFSRFRVLRLDAQGRPMVAIHTGEGPARVWRLCRFLVNGQLDTNFFGANCASAAPGSGATIADLVFTNNNWWLVGSLTINDGQVRQGLAFAQVDTTDGLVRTQTYFPNGTNLIAGGAVGMTNGEGVVVAASSSGAPITQWDAALLRVSYGSAQFFTSIEFTVPYDLGGGNNDYARCIGRDAAGGYLVGVDLTRFNGGQQWGSFRAKPDGTRDLAYAPSANFQGRTVDNPTNIIDYGANVILDGCMTSRDGALNLFGRHVFADPLANGQNSVVGPLFRLHDGGRRDSEFGGAGALPGTDYNPAIASPGTVVHFARPAAMPHPRGDTVEAVAETRGGDLIATGISLGPNGKYTVYAMKIFEATLFRDYFED